ncbi:MAG: 3-dehydroquinate synthase [Phycisphaerae bacterium]|nr:3-dehydroquinate synthase [Phycisphaerae bacterium]
MGASHPHNGRGASEPAYHQRIAVDFDYPVHFTRGLFDADNPLLADVLDRRGERRHRAVAYLDAGCVGAHPGLPRRVKAYFAARAPRLELCACEVVSGGEGAKNGWQSVRDVMWTIGQTHLDRQSFVIAVGGGALLDMVGFAASIVHRGLRLVRVPTTTLAQNDAGIGVKNAMDEHGRKNFVGTFAPPFAVLNDATFLPTLSDRDWIGGVAEAFKVALIEDAAFFDVLCERADALRRRDLEAMAACVRRCAILHLEHIRDAGDPFEFGSARPLDFGHWSAHRLETLSRYRLGHGQAVAVGIALDAVYAARKGLLSDAELERILDGLTACGLPIWCDELTVRDERGRLAVLDGLAQFREHLGGRLCVTLPDGIGRKVELHEMDADLIAECIGELHDRAGRRPAAKAAQ